MYSLNRYDLIHLAINTSQQVLVYYFHCCSYVTTSGVILESGKQDVFLPRHTSSDFISFLSVRSKQCSTCLVSMLHVLGLSGPGVCHGGRCIFSKKCELNCWSQFDNLYFELFFICTFWIRCLQIQYVLFWLDISMIIPLLLIVICILWETHRISSILDQITLKTISSCFMKFRKVHMSSATKSLCTPKCGKFINM